MKTITIAAALVAAAAVTLPASAGFRVEARGGLDAIAVDFDYEEEIVVPVIDPDTGEVTGTETEIFSFSRSEDKSRFGFAGEAGYDHQIGGQFVGVYGAYDTAGDELACFMEPGFGTLCGGFEHTIAGGLRAGIGAENSLRGYAKLGYAQADLTMRIGDASSFRVIEEDRGGVQAGLGAEYALGDSIFYVKGEYVYTDLDDIGDAVATLGVARHQLHAGVGLSF